MKTILVVDDHEISLFIIRRFLQDLSTRFKVLTAENGAEAINVLKAEKVDLVLTDLNMPVMDGFELLTYISETHPDIKAIAMTALQCSDVYEKLRFLGTRHCFEKPFNLQDLKEKIIQLLGKDTGRPEPAYPAQQAYKLKSACSQ